MADLEQRLRVAMHRTAASQQIAADALVAAVLRRHRRRSTVLACLVILLTAALSVTALSVLHRELARPAPATHNPNRKPGPLPIKVTGLPMPSSTNLQLLVSPGNELGSWYSTSSRTVARITGLPAQLGGDAKFIKVPGGYLTTQLRITPFCSSYECAGPPYRYYFIADGSHRATLVGHAVADFGAAAASSSGGVWLSTYAHRSANMATTSATVRLVSTTGQRLGPSYRLPPGYLPIAAAGDDLLLSETFPKSASPREYLLWQPRTGRTVRRIPNPIAARGDDIAWTQWCRGCHVQILDVRTGNSTTTPLVAGVGGWGRGSFSDNGQFFAYDYPGGRVDILSLRTGVSKTVVPALRNGPAVTSGWLNGGPTFLVVVRLPNVSGQPVSAIQIAIWRPGDTVLRVATVTNLAEQAQIDGWHSGLGGP